MIVGKIMTRHVITTDMDHTLESIKKLFEANNFHHVPVVDGETLVGIISDRDVLRELSPYVNTMAEDQRAVNTLKKKAHQFMARNVLTTEENVGIADAGEIMLNNHISCLPVLSESGVIRGILTRTDILRAFLKSLPPAE